MRDDRNGMDRQGFLKKKGTSSCTASTLIRPAFETVQEDVP